MKIFQVIQKPQARGVEFFTCLLSGKLKELGHDVILISLFEGNFDLPFSGQQIHLKRSIKNRLWDLRAWSQFAELIKTENPDLIQANAADTLKFTVLSKKLFGWKTPLIFRNASQISQYIQSPLIKNFNKYLYNQIDGIISVSSNSKSDFNSIFYFNKAHEVIPIGIEIPKSKSYFIKTENPLLVHIGGFTFEKNHSELMDIFSEVQSQYPTLKLWLFGEGPKKASIENQVKKMNLKDSVIFKGIVPKPFEVIPRNSIILLPSKIEGLPAVILEAFANKIPVIAYDVGGVSEVLTEETGWLISKCDKNAFIKSILEVHQMDELKKENILDQAFQLINENYSIENITTQFEKFYLRVVTALSI
ncbi:glycosyltransferase [Algoriphagus halophilus]|uniref:Glycosyltransferase involved in cell wall bisynthesis n=1 Tax=Algoriphagus halophilus TaxID=226505 RepID=A0A1N6ECF7_9BACT|nr:glycosyltransferase [Algoriphagus halophilus]SIN80722.1 Glycosyltransferase involved in cell wall bisynthesis [Algoriphagus halophilus]